MSTIWEIAATIRAEDEITGGVDKRKRDNARRIQLTRERPIDLREQERVSYWCKILGATRLQLYRAVEAVGEEPAAVRRFLAGAHA